MRLAIISDIHEDLVRLKRIIGKIDKKGYDSLVCLGDISGFSLPYYKYEKTRNAKACLDLVREKCHIIIPGNHDLHAAGKIPELSDIFPFPENWYEMDAGERRELAGDELWLHADDLAYGYGPDDLEFFRGLPEYEILETPELNIFLSHYASPNLSGFRKKFYTTEREFSTHFQEMEKHACLLAFIGHAHPRGFFEVSENAFRHFTYRKHKMAKFPAIIGVPPVTRHKYRSGFCIFDSRKSLVKAYR
jgi:predicted phosphodiesterase